MTSEFEAQVGGQVSRRYGRGVEGLAPLPLRDQSDEGLELMPVELRAT